MHNTVTLAMKYIKLSVGERESEKKKEKSERELDNEWKVLDINKNKTKNTHKTNNLTNVLLLRLRFPDQMETSSKK